MSRLAKFFAVGVLGFVVQIAALAVLVRLGWMWLPATVVAVECAIVHNYFWHQRWTWSERSGSAGFVGFAGFARFARFNGATGVTSIVGNVVLMAIFVTGMGMPVIPANVLAVGAMSLANFVIGDRWVFAVALCAVAVPAYAGPKPETLAAWQQYVAKTEARIAAVPADGGLSTRTMTANGTTFDVESGTISDWHGSVFIRGVSLDEFLHRLQNPGTPPPQEDVTSSAVLARTPDALRIYMRLVRHAIVTVTYDTEHTMTFHRLSPALATAQSVATRIEEVGGGDKGFLWKLNSYWRYRAVDGGVMVSVDSLTLSREVPLLVRPIAGRIVPRIARESMLRTLQALVSFFG